MQVYSTLASVVTVVSFVIFVGIVCWAWSGRRKASFDAAAIEPFALPDETGARHPQSGARAASRLDTNTSEGARP
jgi:cytochrome c oxidase cbb3-type subunit 4